MVPQSPPPSTAAADSDPFKNFFHTFLTTYPITSFFWLLIFIFLLMIFLHLAWRDCGAPCLRTLKAREERKNKNVLKVLPPAVKYKTSEEERMRPCTGCAICLEDFKDGELCQVLPFCYHAFHSDCINPWLITKQSCPNCRAPVHPQT